MRRSTSVMMMTVMMMRGRWSHDVCCLVLETSDNVFWLWSVFHRDFCEQWMDHTLKEYFGLKDGKNVTWLGFYCDISILLSDCIIPSPCKSFFFSKTSEICLSPVFLNCSTQKMPQRLICVPNWKKKVELPPFPHFFSPSAFPPPFFPFSSSTPSSPPCQHYLPPTWR